MSEMTLKQAINEAGKWGHLMRSLSTITDVLKAVEGADQHLKETADLIERNKAAAVKAGNEAAKAEAEAANAKAQAQDILASAKAAAALVLAEATAEADALKAGAAEAVKDAKKKTDAAKARADDFEAKSKALAAEVASLDSKLKAAQESARKLLGG
jgi:colicin import membrane protein